MGRQGIVTRRPQGCNYHQQIPRIVENLVFGKCLYEKKKPFTVFFFLKNLIGDWSANEKVGKHY